MHFVRHYSLYRYEKTELETLLETKYHIPVMYEYSEKDRREAKWLEISSHNQKVCPTKG